MQLPTISFLTALLATPSLAEYYVYMYTFAGCKPEHQQGPHQWTTVPDFCFPAMNAGSYRFENKGPLDLKAVPFTGQNCGSDTLHFEEVDRCYSGLFGVDVCYGQVGREGSWRCGSESSLSAHCLGDAGKGSRMD